MKNVWKNVWHNIIRHIEVTGMRSAVDANMLR